MNTAKHESTNPRIVFENQSPVTQSVEAVKALIMFHNHGRAPDEMPAFYRLTGEMVLALSARKDAYYVVTPRTCSCPAATYRPGSPCKHQRKYFPRPAPQAAPKAVDDAGPSLRPTGKWAGGRNGPFLEVA